MKKFWTKKRKEEFLNRNPRATILNQQFNVDKILIDQNFYPAYKLCPSLNSDLAAYFTRLMFKNCKFEDINFHAVMLEDTKYEDCTFKNVNFKCAHWQHSSLKNVCFEDCTFDWMSFNYSMLENVIFHNCRMKMGIFTFAECNNVNFPQFMDDCNFEAATIENSSFYYNKLTNCDFIGTTFNNVNLHNAIFDSKTSFRNSKFKNCFRNSKDLEILGWKINKCGILVKNC